MKFGGFPPHTQDSQADISSLDHYLIKNPDASFVLKAQGDSMAEAGIFQNDLVIVERGKVPKTGDIIIFFEDEGYVMKSFNRKKFSECKVEAVVVGVVRRL